MDLDPIFGEEAVDTETNRPVWWDGSGWSYIKPADTNLKSTHASIRRHVPALKQQRRDLRVPLSYAQQRLWFIDQLDGGSTAYHMPEALRLRGRLDKKALEKAINTIVARHESLRTRFAEVEGEPVQVIEAEMQIAVGVEDLRGMEREEQEERVREEMRREGVERFDLERGPLIRMKVLELGEEEHVLLRTLHHIVSDGWSQGVLNREMGILYEAYVEGRENPLQPLGVQYGDFALWQRNWLEGEGGVLEEGLKYWKEELAGIPEGLELPTDRVRPAVQSYGAEVWQTVLRREQVEGLKKLGQERQATLYMVLLAGLGVLLGRYSGQEDVVVGTPIANRQDEQLEEMIGFFVNTLVLRVRVKGEGRIGELVEEVRRTALKAYEHQDVPFEKLVEELSPERSLNRTPIFQVMLALQNTPQVEARLKGMEVEVMGREDKKTNFDLEVHAWDTHGEFKLLWLYNRELFDRWRIEQMARHYVRVLDAALANKDMPLHQLELATPAEQDLLLRKWNQATGSYDLTLVYSQVFERQAKESAHQTAVIWNETRLTYEELNRRANQFANLLISKGANQEMVVALLAFRSLDFLTAVLAILKAGAAYLPLDPSHPPRRHLQVLQQSNAPLVLCARALLPFLSEAISSFDGNPAPEVLVLEDLMLQPCGQDNPPIRCSPDNLAYVLFTSGSTGVPKGVMIHQRGMMNHFWANIEALHMNGSDVMAQTASQSFDISVWQFLAPLIIGGQVHIFDDEITSDPPRLLREVDRCGITIFETVPSLLQVAVAQTRGPEAPRLALLQHLLITGEAADARLCQEWFNEYPHIPLVNAYGPAECSDDVTLYAMEKAPQEEFIRVPIGYPVRNLRVSILDHNLHLAPIGVPGELYIRGVGVGRGYLNEPDRTAAVFLPDVFSDEPGLRMYRSGDRACYRVDGCLEFLGRMDYQVKVRGIRIEPSEIEAALRSHHGVQEAAVLVHGTATEKQLAAYVVLSQKGVKTAELRAYLQKRLPRSMVPGMFVYLPELPLTANGKLDRKSLPQPSYDLTEPTYVPPRTETEKTLAKIWCEVLHLENVGVHDNFFDLGGHSLTAIGLMAKIKTAFGRRLPLSVLFRATTIAALSEILDKSLKRVSSSVLVPIQSSGHKRPFFCIHPGGGIVYSYIHLAQALGVEQPFYALESIGLSEGQAPHTSVEAMADCYIKEIQTIQLHGPYMFGGWSFGGLVAFEIARRLELMNEETNLVALFDSQFNSDTPLGEEADRLNLTGEDSELFAEIFYDHIPGLKDILRRTNPRDRLSFGFRLANQFDLLPADFDLEDLRRLLNVTRANSLAMKNYEPKTYGGKVTIFRAEETFKQFGDLTASWKKLALGGVEVCIVPGKHSTMTRPPYVHFLADSLNKWLDNARVVNS